MTFLYRALSPALGGFNSSYFLILLRDYVADRFNSELEARGYSAEFACALWQVVMGKDDLVHFWPPGVKVNWDGLSSHWQMPSIQFRNFDASYDEMTRFDHVKRPKDGRFDGMWQRLQDQPGIADEKKTRSRERDVVLLQARALAGYLLDNPLRTTRDTRDNLLALIIGTESLRSDHQKRIAQKPRPSKKPNIRLIRDTLADHPDMTFDEFWRHHFENCSDSTGHLGPCPEDPEKVLVAYKDEEQVIKVETLKRNFSRFM